MAFKDISPTPFHASIPCHITMGEFAQFLNVFIDY